MIKISDKNNCSGCHACANICPKGCITMQRDYEGFLYPSVDQLRCINCNLCEKVCPLLKCEEKAPPEISAFAAHNLNEDMRLQSSSGGIFTLLAEWILNQGGVVFGAAMDKNQICRHICVHSEEELALLRGSKYVQSTIGSTYKDAERCLNQGIPVLFTGTPCQIAGLYAYLRKEFENLYTQDIICHGVPSPMVWEKYVDYREKAASSKTNRMFFRNKKYGWKTYCVKFEFSNFTQYEKSLHEDLYMKAFLKNLCLRPSCYNCKAKGVSRTSDITLADFWGVWNVLPEMYDDKGTSLVLINSAKGEKLFNSIKHFTKYNEVNFAKAIEYNSAYSISVKCPKKRNKFMADVLETGFNKISKYVNDSIIKRVVNKLYHISRKLLSSVLGETI